MVLQKKKTNFISYLFERFQYTKIDTFKCKIRMAPSCSVLQGSKLSGIIYSLHTNELPKLKDLMKDKDIVKWMTDEDETNYDDVKN